MGNRYNGYNDDNERKAGFEQARNKTGKACYSGSQQVDVAFPRWILRF